MKRPWGFYRRLGGAACWALLLSVAGNAPELYAQADEPIKYRRIFVPQAELDGQIRGLLPLAREEFDRRIARIPQGSNQQPSSPARIDRAEYKARWDGSPLLSGAAELEVQSGAAAPTVMSLGQCGLALHDAVWKDDPPRAAVIGSDPAGVSACVVERSGTMQWNWSLRGTIEAGGRTAFSLRLPPATTSSLLLDLPADHSLEVEGGIASPVAAGNSDPAAKVNAQPPRQSWLVEFGGPGVALLRISPAPASGTPQPVATVRETSTYSLLRSALDLETSLDVDTFHQRLPQLKLHVERPLEITSIRMGELMLPWFVSASDERAQTVVVPLDDPQKAPPLALTVQAVAPWTTDEPTTLPRVTLDDAVYQEGRATVSAPAWLRLHARSVRGCWQSGVLPASPAGGNDQLQFRLHSADAAIEVGANLASAGLREASGTQLVIDATQVTATMVAELTSLGGSRFFVEARIPRRWIVDSVDVQPADALSDRLLTAATPDQQLLRLNLKRSVPDSRPLRVVIRGHHRRPADDGPLPDDFFRLATFSDVRTARRLVAVRSVEPGVELQVEDDERLTTLDPARLPEEEMRLFDAVPGTLLFAADQDAVAAQATLTTAAPAYRAEAQLDARVGLRQVQQALKLRVVPASSPVGQLVVALSPKPAGQITWSLAGEDARQLSAKLLSPEAPDNETDATYHIDIVRPRSAPFEIVADWVSPSARRYPISVPVVPNASSQTGVVRVHSAEAAALVIDATGVQSLPLPPVAGDQTAALRGLYSYQPGGRAEISVITLPAGAAPPAGWIESMRVESHFSPAGDGEHEATLQVVSHGLVQLDVRLPPSAAELRHVDPVSGEWLALTRSTEGRFTVPLPAGQKEVIVQLRYLSSRAPGASFPSWRCEAPLPETDLPTLSRMWSVALGPGLRATHDGGDWRPNFAALAAAWKRVGGGSTAADPRRQARPSILAAMSAPAAHRPNRAPASLENSSPSNFKLAGWRVYELELPPAPSAFIQVYQPAAVQAAGIAVFLLTLGAVLYFGWRKPGWMVAAAALGVVLTAVSTADWTPLAGGLSLGFIGGMAAWLLRGRSPAPVHERSTVATRRRLVLMTAIAAAFACHCVARSMADETLAQAKDRKAAIADHRVVIAVDDEQQPTGDYVFLSPEFYDRLHRLSDAGQTALPDWLLATAHYQLPAAPRLEGPAPSIDEIVAQFDLETFRAKVEIELPFDRKQIHLLEGRGRLDGELVVPTWREDGGALRFVVASPGRHRLELAFGAPAATTGEAVVLDLGIPAIVHSVVTTPPSSQAPPTIVSAQGGELAASVPGARQTALGASNRLTVHWLDDKPAPARVEVDQLIWWKLRPGSIIARGRFRFRPIGGALDRVRIEFDPRLRLVPGSIVPASGSIKMEEGPRHVAEITLTEKADAEFTLDAMWQWKDASTVGNFSLPQITAHGDRTMRSWTAISVDPSLSMSLPSGARASVPAEEFLVAWNEPDAAPDTALDDLAATGSRSFMLVPAASQPSVAAVASWSLDSQRARVQFEARLAGVPDIRFQHLLDLPPSLKVTRVALSSNDVPLAHRWIQQPNGKLIVTLLDKPAPEQLLVVEGTVGPVRNRPRLPLPLIDLQQAEVTSHQMRIYRAADVRVRVLDATGWNSVASPELGHQVDGLGRLVAQLDQSASQPSEPNLAVSTNRPQLSGRLGLRVADDRGQWTCEADLDLQVDRGLLDQIRLEFPAEWSGPFEIVPAAEHRIVPLAGGARQELIIRPQQAAGDQLHLSLHGSLRSATGKPLEAPNVKILGAPQVQRFVVLDDDFDGQTVVWKMRGLQAVEPGAVILPEHWRDSGREVFRVVDEDFEATPSFPTRAKKRSQVTLADIAIARSAGTRFVGRAAYFVETADDDMLVLDMPRDVRLVHVSIDGVPAQCSPDGLRSWSIKSAAQKLPVAVEVLFEGTLPDSPPAAGGARIAAPRLRGLTVQRTLWSLDKLEPATGSGAAASPRLAGDLEAALVRVECFARSLDRIADFPAGDLPPSVLGQIYRGWRRQYHLAQAALELRIREDSSNDKEFLTRLQTARQMAIDADRRMVQSGTDVAVNEASVPVEDAASRTILLATGWQGSVGVRARSVASPGGFRWAALGGAILLGAVVWMTGRRHAVSGRIAALAPALMALIGLGWWLLAPWAWLGWLPVAAAVWLAVRSPWNTGHRLPEARVSGRSFPWA